MVSTCIKNLQVFFGQFQACRHGIFGLRRKPPGWTRLCIQDDLIATGDFAAEAELISERLPTCHYERQKASSTGLRLRAMKLEDPQK